MRLQNYLRRKKTNLESWVIACGFVDIDAMKERLHALGLNIETKDVTDTEIIIARHQRDKQKLVNEKVNDKPAKPNSSKLETPSRKRKRDLVISKE